MADHKTVWRDYAAEIWNDQELEAREKIVLLALAQHMGEHDGDWYCWPLRSTLIAMTGLPRRTFDKITGSLEARGYLTRETAKGITRRSGNSAPNLWRIFVGKYQPESADRGAHGAPLKPVDNQPRGAHGAPLKPVDNQPRGAHGAPQGGTPCPSGGHTVPPEVFKEVTREQQQRARELPTVDNSAAVGSPAATVEDWLLVLNQETRQPLELNTATQNAIRRIMQMPGQPDPVAVASWIKRRHPMISTPGGVLNALRRYEPPAPRRREIDYSALPVADCCDWPLTYCAPAAGCQHCAARAAANHLAGVQS